MFDVQPTPYDVSFRFLGFPVRVHPLFWIVIAILGMPHEFADMQKALLGLGIWIAAAFVSILIHEAGHALVFRHVFHVHSHIVFYGLGGLTFPTSSPRRTGGFYGMLRQVFLSFAGPLAGFLLAASVMLAFVLFLVPSIGIHGAIQAAADSIGAFSLTPILLEMNLIGSPIKLYLVQFLLMVVLISVIWGLFNLLPIHPMDGGQISREIFSYFSPRHGTANSLVLSMTVAVGIGVLAFLAGRLFITVLFGFFAFQNYRELMSGSLRYR